MTVMKDMIECQCLQCGISLHLELQGLTFEPSPAGDHTMVREMYCTECGGELVLVGKVGEEPYYRTAS